MADVVIADRRPVAVDLEPGTYSWCACGRSKNQPFCDGSHAGTGIFPVRFTIEEKCRKAMCLCKHSGTKPFCDGTHRTL